MLFCAILQTSAANCSYLSYLGFQLHTHHDLFKGDDGDEEPIMTFAGAITTLAGITVLVAVCSE
jgi:Ca2+:H+ antiporter